MGNNSLSPVLIILAIFAIAGIALAVVLISRKGKTGSTLPRVVVASGNHQGRQVNVGAQPVVIGRDADCGIVIDEPLISRKHVQVSFANGIFTLEDLGSAHGTYVNGMRAYQERVPPGTQFTIGNVTLSVLSGAVTPQIRQAAPVVVPLAAPPRVSTVQAGAASGLEGYEIKEKIKEGGQVIVHRALSKSDGRQVVIKFLSTVSYDTEGKFFRRKFEQQLEVGASIRHPHCVQIDGGSANSNPPYMVEEFLSGGTLLDRMRAGTLTLADVIRIIGQTCDALGYLHKRDIIHRDVTPSNIMFDPAGQVKVIDFGVAHFANMPSATSVGMVVGKVKYLSVEAANGARVVPQSDLYSLGIIAYEMLAGKPPFMGSDPDVLAQHLRTRPVPLRQVNPAIPERIEWAVMKALEKNPADRFRNAEEMARAFTYDAAGNVPFDDRTGGSYGYTYNAAGRMSEFRINGFLNHYPDFIVKTKAGRIIALETKGDDRDNSDSELKLKLGKLWEAKAGRDFRYMMVFENNPIDGAERLADALAKIRQL